MKTGRIRHFFAGGNTGEGFYSFYNQVIDVQTTYLYILKGGPGTGKSTLIRTIGEELGAQGYHLEYLHCSSDNNSLDGLVVPSLKTAFLDGTAPHTLDPSYPGVADEIINLGSFWDQQGLKANKERIITISQKKKACYERAYVYLNAALGVYRNWRKTNFSCLNHEAWLRTWGELKEEIFNGRRPTGQLGRLRHLFASAITADGPVHFLESIFGEATRLYILDGPPGSGRAEIIQRLETMSIDFGLDTEVFHCALEPQKYEHLWLPALKIGVLTSTWPHKYPSDDRCRLIETGCFLQNQQHLFTETLKESRLVFLDLWERAINWLHKAKKLHAELEEYYGENMDFTHITRIRKEILGNLLCSPSC
ncbi:MAG: hypothetical protein GX081_05735 [Firmicutes bacterium]|nr:hypothetical protein [Bacillota bacterium]